MTEYLTAKDLAMWLLLKRDNPRTCSANAASGQKDINMGENIIHFSVGDTINISDTATPKGEELVIASISGTIITCTTNLVNSYTTARRAKVENQGHWTPVTYPTKEFIDDIIEMNEAVLDKDIHTTFKQDGVQVEEWSMNRLRGNIEYPYLSMPLRYPFDTQDPFEFKYRRVCPLDPSKGDSIFYQYGSEWKDLLDPVNGIKVWEDVIDTIVSAHSLSGASPITATLAVQPRIATPLKWSLSHSNITAFSMVITGKDQAGTTITETVTQADGWYGYTTNFYQSITSIVFTRTTGTGTGDTLSVTTQKDSSRLSGDYDCWIDYDHSLFYPKSLIIDDSIKTMRAKYRYSRYYETNSIPKDIKKMVLLLCGMDILGNERYATNLPGGGGTDQTKLEIQINIWRADYNRMVAKRRAYFKSNAYQ